MWSCRNRRIACQLYGRLLTTLFFLARPDLEQRTTSTLPFKTMDYNVIYNKLNLRENKKRKADGASISREEPPQVEDDFYWLESLEDEEKAPAPLQEEAKPPTATIVEEHLEYLRISHETSGSHGAWDGGHEERPRGSEEQLQSTYPRHGSSLQVSP